MSACAGRFLILAQLLILVRERPLGKHRGNDCYSSAVKNRMKHHETATSSYVLFLCKCDVAVIIQCVAVWLRINLNDFFKEHTMNV